MTQFFRAPGSRIEHLTRDGRITLCGLSARLGARYTASDVRQDHKIRPMCTACEKEVSK